ncbi:hypothetical protein IFO70_24970 [Phormidium tenue FACHB-886]|nr:hypothetical protein [Phormidium tenue FACHB-886]
MQTTTILQLAQQGQPQAIAALINQMLRSKGITAKVTVKERTLKILLEGSTVPDQASLTAFVLKGVTSLKIQTLNKLQIFGKSTDQPTAAWTQVYSLNSTSTEPDIVVDSSAQNANPISTTDASAATGVSALSNNLEAIADLLNRAIADDQITIKTTQEDKLLKIIVETNKFIDGQSFASRIHQELKVADLSNFETVSIYKQKPKGQHSFQIKSFTLTAPEGEATQPRTSQEDTLQLSINSRELSGEKRTSRLNNQAATKPKLKIRRLISVGVIGVLAAFFIIRTLKRMLFVIWLSPALGGFSLILGLVILWRAWSILRPLLLALLRDE